MSDKEIKKEYTQADGIRDAGILMLVGALLFFLFSVFIFSTIIEPTKIKPENLLIIQSSNNYVR